MKKFYITTSIAYPNSNPHIGYALELAQADFLARYYRMMGYEVRLVTGVDAHGLKIQKAADIQGVTPEEFVKQKIVCFKNLADGLQIKYDRFISTEDQDHIIQAQEIWQKCAAKGDIYKKRYRAWYNVKEEEFLGMAEDAEGADDKDKIAERFEVNSQFVELIDEENYFFALSKYQDEIVRLIESDEYKVVPENRKLELLNFVKDKGLADISVSREKSKLAWGVAVPDDPDQVMYVWFDALVNYLTAAKTDNQNYWPADLHCVGKDISRFHALIWIGMLLSAEVLLPKELLVHGFITNDGRKMSKSIGNVVDPMPVIARYGASATRWFLLKEIPTTDDGDYAEERMEAVYAADLANDYGNLVSRVWNMAQKYFGGKVPEVDLAKLGNVEQMLVAEKWQKYHELVEARQIDGALKQTHELVVMCNRWIEENKPWAMAKDENQSAALAELIYELLEVIRHISLMFYPVMPEICERVLKSVLLCDWDYQVTDWSRVEAWGGMVPGNELVEEAIILFPRLER